MSVLVSGPIETEWITLTDNTLTTILSVTKHTGIVFMAVQENTGGTPSITLYREDKSGVKHYFKNAEALTAKQRITFDEVFYLHGGDTIKAQSSDAAGKIALYVTYRTN